LSRDMTQMSSTRYKTTIEMLNFSQFLVIRAWRLVVTLRF